MLSWGEASIELMYRERAWVEVDVSAIDHNIHQIRSLLNPATELLSVIKADAYGHGAVTVAKSVLQAGATWLGVATIPEGIELRKAGLTAPILVLGATNQPDQVESLIRWHLQPTLCTPKQAMVFAETVGDRRKLPVHIKIDTGMSRLGVPWQEAQSLINWVQRSPNLEIASIYSHCATADELDQTIMWEQQQRFEQVLKEAEIRNNPNIKLHFANSAATISDRRLHYDMVRTGLVTYGCYPAEHLKNQVKLQPALQVKARITQIKTIAPGTGVSYGYRFVADREMQIATMGIGYADGIPRSLSNQMQVGLHGQWVKQIGSITMDQIVLDVSNVPNVEVGDVVTLLGKDGSVQISADDWANKIGTISWEILCGFKNRLPRVTIGRNQPSELMF